MQPPAKPAIAVSAPLVGSSREQRAKPPPSLYAPDVSAPEWAALAERSANVFATAEWLSVWWRHFGGGRERLTAFWRRTDGRLIAIVPLYRSSRGPFRMLRIAGHGPSDQLGPVCAPEDELTAAAALREWLARTPDWHIFLGERLPARRDWTRLVGGTELVRETTPTLSLEGLSWEGYLAGRSPNFRQQLRRRERKLAREHRLGYRLADDPARLQADLDVLFRLHRARWGADSVMEGPLGDFHREFAPLALERGWLRLWFLELDGRSVAAWYGFRYAGVDSYYQAGRDLRYASKSVGLVLLGHTVRDAIGAGSHQYRFLRGGEAYKSRFTAGDDGLQTLALPRGPLGRAAIVGAQLAKSTLPAGRRLLAWAAG